MTGRERLIELLLQSKCQPKEAVYILADYLLDHGVIVPPCKVGDAVYFVYDDNTIDRATAHGIYVSDYGVRVHCCNQFGNKGFGVTDIGKTVFLTREEAEEALEARENDA